MFQFLLAATENGSRAGDNTQVVPLDFIWGQITSLNWLQAVIGISFGLVYLLYGWRIFRILVVISFGLVGMYLGMKAGQKFGTQNDHMQLWGGVLGMFAMSILAMNLIRWGVSLLGAAAGGVVTGGLWYAFGLPQQYLWAGAVIGVVAGGRTFLRRSSAACELIDARLFPHHAAQGLLRQAGGGAGGHPGGRGEIRRARADTGGHHNSRGRSVPLRDAVHACAGFILNSHPIWGRYRID